MNFFGHAAIAGRFRASPEFVFGAMLRSILHDGPIAMDSQLVTHSLQFGARQ